MMKQLLSGAFAAATFPRRTAIGIERTGTRGRVGALAAATLATAAVRVKGTGAIGCGCALATAALDAIATIGIERTAAPRCRALATATFAAATVGVKRTGAIGRVRALAAAALASTTVGIKRTGTTSGRRALTAAALYSCPAVRVKTACTARVCRGHHRHQAQREGQDQSRQDTHRDSFRRR